MDNQPSSQPSNQQPYDPISPVPSPINDQALPANSSGPDQQVSPPTNLSYQEILNLTNYRIQHQVGLLKEKFKVEDPSGNVLLWASTPSMTLHKEFHVYSDDSDTNEVMDMRIHKLIELSENWDITDQTSHSSLGSIKEKAGMIEHWSILNIQSQEIAEISGSAGNLISNLTNMVGMLEPRRYTLTSTSNGAVLATYDQVFETLTMKFDMDFSMDPQHSLDRRIGLAAGLAIAHRALKDKEERGRSGGGIGLIR